MMTVMRRPFGATASPPAKTSQNQDQLRRDRRTAIIVVAVMAAVMGLIIWLASMTGGSLPEGVDYWQMMP
jgi:ferric-dicitrate binding protein FerR (iron transport regulator)